MRFSFLILVLLSFSSIASKPTISVGSMTINFIDPDRNNRIINTAIYYPAVTSGNNAPIAQGSYPVIVFGHGFVMVHTAYEYLWNNLVPKGYILAFPTTEGSFTPNHLNLGLDLAFIIKKLKNEGQNPASFFFGAVAETSAVMGHSMGGGASFLACQNNNQPTTMVTFAAAITNPSSVIAAANVNIPTLLFAGELDCVTPPPAHQYPMYEATASQKKMIIEVLGGGHCGFADYNLPCSIGEASCTPQPTISRTQQQSVTLNIINSYFEYLLKGNLFAWQGLLDTLQSSGRVNYNMNWNTLSAGQLTTKAVFKTYPNPFSSNLTIESNSEIKFDSVMILNSKGAKILEASFHGQHKIEINTQKWPRGTYIVILTSGGQTARRKIIKR